METTTVQKVGLKDYLVWGSLILIVALAAWFRLYDLQSYPPGLFPDEAANGEDALLIIDGDARAFYPRGNGREGLYFFLQAASIKYFGIGVWQLKLVSALIGVASVAAIYFSTRVWFGRLAGLLAAFFLATNHWHVTMSRTGFRAILIPLFVASFTACAGYVVKSVKDNKQKQAYIFAALAGALLAGGFYTYIAYRVMIGAVLGILILVLLDDLILEWKRHKAEHIRDLPHVVRYWKHIVVASVSGSIVLMPLILFFIEEPAAFVGRAGQVSVFNRELQAEYGGGTLLGTILYSTRETVLAFFAGEGDLNWRHNVAGFPLLAPWVGILGLLGATWAIWGTVRTGIKIWMGKEVHLGMVWPYLLLLIGGMTLPVITTAEGMPHGLRSIGLIVPIFILVGAAGAAVWWWISKKSKTLALRQTILGVGVGLLLLDVAYGGVLYFVLAKNDPEAHYAYRSDLTAVAEFINENAEARLFDSAQSKPYLVLDGFSIQTIHFLTAVDAHEYVLEGEVHPDVEEHKWRQVQPEIAEETQLETGELIIFTQSTFPDADRYEVVHGDSIELMESRINRFGEEVFRVYRGK